MDDIPKGTLQSASQLATQIGKIEKLLNPILNRDINDIHDSISPLESAKLNVMLAYTVNALYFMYLQTQGIPTEDHPINQEIERVKEYMKKLAEIANPPKPNRIDKEAAERFIKHNLSAPQKRDKPSGDTSQRDKQKSHKKKKKKN
eukprot:TRINITY_DN3120_c0_g1_i1.p1 TRINITY_DN3120_c0_g1~~TRINITY_DN3120_c0_g1_i1.p1  ORF type:complete len:146 (-),score=45.65 TRINITY_DN3120_c0_g1_i1:2-439(-)